MMPMSKSETLFEEILRPFPDGTAGPYLRYDPVYDQIRQARTEDDHRLSRGVWQTELKKADHFEAEKHCIDALTARSKDFQIVGWLAESWFVQYGLSGLLDGIKLINAFAAQYWKTMHPVDEEHRLRLFEWMDTDFSKHLHIFPLTAVPNASKQYSYQDQVLAKTFDQALRREPESSQKQIERANKRGDPLLPHVMRAFEQTPKEVFIKSFQSIKEIEAELKTFKSFVEEKMGKDAPSFSQIFSTLTNMKKVIAVPEEEKVEEVSASANVTSTTPDSNDTAATATKVTHSAPTLAVSSAAVATRADAYKRLRELADAFGKIEPHSPTANVLHKVSKWEDKQLVDILSDFSKSPDALSIFMNFISKE